MSLHAAGSRGVARMSGWVQGMASIPPARLMRLGLSFKRSRGNMRPGAGHSVWNKPGEATQQWCSNTAEEGGEAGMMAQEAQCVKEQGLRGPQKEPAVQHTGNVSTASTQQHGCRHQQQANHQPRAALVMAAAHASTAVEVTAACNTGSSPLAQVQPTYPFALMPTQHNSLACGCCCCFLLLFPRGCCCCCCLLLKHAPPPASLSPTYPGILAVLPPTPHTAGHAPWCHHLDN